MEEVRKFAESVSFINPEYFSFFFAAAFMAGLVLAGFAFYLWMRPQRTQGSRYSLTGKAVSRLLLVISLCFAVVALARPVTTYPVETYVRGPVDLIAVVDISSSMWADDIYPSRLEIARRELMALNNRELVKDGDRLSIIVFGAKPSTRTYLTPDLRRFFNDVADLRPPNYLTQDRFAWGSDISGAFREIYMSADALDNLSRADNNIQPELKTNRFAVVFTDGDFEINDDIAFGLRQAKMELLNRGITVYAVGVGTASGINLLSSIKRIEGDPPALRGIEEDLAGVMTALNPGNLAGLAVGSRSRTILLQSENESAREFLNDAIGAHRNEISKSVSGEGQNDFWHYFMLASLFFFVLFILFY